MSIATLEIQPRADQVEFTGEMLSVTLKDRRVVLVPLNWYPRLLQATPIERHDWRVFEDSEGRDIIFWESLDELIPVIALLNGIPSRESARSFEHWLAEKSSG